MDEEMTELEEVEAALVFVKDVAKSRGLISPEIDVLIATGIWLHSQGWTVESVSVAHGQDIDKSGDTKKLIAKFSELRIPHEHIRFRARGADLVARKDSMIWKIECKGLGWGTGGTPKNNFDRALASTVSYFDQPSGLRLGLAMPRSEKYVHFIKSRIPQALREKLDLWILLYDSAEDAVYPYEPDKTVL